MARCKVCGGNLAPIPLTAQLGLCLQCIGALYGNRQPSPSPYSNPVALAGSGTGAYNAQALAQQAQQAIAQQALLAQQAANPGLGNFVYNIATDQFTELAPLPAADIPTVGELTGYRIWYLQFGDAYLSSITAGRIWSPHEPMSGTPGDHDHLGVWAFKTHSRALQKFLESYPGHAVGSVSLWGQVIEHEDGYRAEFAKVKSIDDISLDHRDPHSRWWRPLADQKSRFLSHLRKLYSVEPSP